MKAGQLGRAAARSAEVTELADRHGFDQWRLEGDTCTAAVSGLSALAADKNSGTSLANHVETLSALLDTLRRLEINRFTTFYDAVLGRLLVAAGRAESARAHLDAALGFADKTQMRF
jgi:hypothetical protein